MIVPVSGDHVDAEELVWPLAFILDFPLTFDECQVHVSYTMIEMIFVHVLCKIVMIYKLTEMKVYFIALVLSLLNACYLKYKFA